MRNTSQQIFSSINPTETIASIIIILLHNYIHSLVWTKEINEYSHLLLTGMQVSTTIFETMYQPAAECPKQVESGCGCNFQSN